MNTQCQLSFAILGSLAVLGAACQDVQPVARVSQAVGCNQAVTYMDPWLCEQLDRSGIVNVMCPYDVTLGVYAVGGGYAHPDDDCDDTAAMQAALDRAKQRATVVMPAGAITLSPPYEASAYLISAPIRVTARGLVGTRHSTAKQGTRVRILPGADLAGTAGAYAIPLPAGFGTADYWPGAMFYAANAPARLEALSIEADGAADYGIYLGTAPDSVVREVTVDGTRVAGLLADKSGRILIDHVTSSNNQNDGLVVSGANGGSMLRSRSDHDGRHGMVVTVRTGDDETGGFTVLGGLSEVAGGHGVYVAGTRSAVNIQDVWVEQAVDDGIRVDDAYHVNIQGNRVSGTNNGNLNGTDSVNHAIQLSECQHCTVRVNQISNSVLCAYNYEDIWLLGDCRYNYVAENMFGTSMTVDLIHGNPATCGEVDRFEVVYEVSGTKTRMSQHLRSHLSADEPPATSLDGYWRAGDIIWNRSPSVGEPFGWMCVANAGVYSHQCTSWKPMGTIP